ncbi:MAG: CYTH domain-containing protein, partial [Patescibacteria group bacterium]
KSIGAKNVGEFFYKRITFDFPDLNLHDKGAWLRLRDEGDRVTLTWKKRLGMKAHDGSASDDGMEEVEVVVSDFDQTATILRSIGMVDKFYQENRRTRYKKGVVEFDIDIWPRLNPYLEIESSSWEEVDKAINELGLDPKDKKIFSTNQIYMSQGIDEHEYTYMGFGEWTKRT